MNSLKYIIGALFLIGLVACQSYDNPLSNQLDKKIIKTESKFAVDIHNSNISTLIYKKEFDSEGNLLEFLEYSQAGIIQTRSTFTYNDLESKESKHKYDATGNLATTHNYLYLFQDDGKVKEKHTLDESGIVKSKEIFNYDANGNLLKKVLLVDGATVASTIDYSYKYNGGNLVERLIEENSTSGKVQSRDRISYIRQDNKLEIFNYNQSGNIVKIKTIYYNQFGQVSIEIESNGQRELISKYAFRYEYYE